MTTDNLNRLKAVLDAYGADPARWPDADRVALAHLLESHGGLMDEAGEIDQVLAAAVPPASPQGAHGRLAQMTQFMPQETPAEEPAPDAYQTFGVSRFAAGATLAASLVIGVYMGTLGSLDPLLLSVGDDGLAIIVTDFEDPFDLESLIGNSGEGSG